MVETTKKSKYLSLSKDLNLVTTGLELNSIKDVDKEIKQIEELFKKESELFDVLTDPDISAKEKYSLIDNIFKGNISDKVVDLIKRIFVKYNEVVTVTAITAVLMKEDAKNKLIETLKIKLDKDIVFFNEVDKSIIGGVLLKIGDKVFDNTLRTQLRDIKRSLDDIQFYGIEV